MSEKIDLTHRCYEADHLAQMALRDERLFRELLDGVSAEPKPEAMRGNCSQALLYLAKTNPQALMPYWDYLSGLLHSDNGYTLYVAVYVMAALARIDTQGRAENICGDMLALLADNRAMVVAHAAKNAGDIALAKKECREEVIKNLLRINPIHNGKNIDLVIAYAIDSVDLLYDTADNKAEILAFVREQTKCKSPKTRKVAKMFLKKRGTGFD